MKPIDIKKLIKKKDKGWHSYAVVVVKGKITFYRDGKIEKNFTIDWWLKT